MNQDLRTIQTLISEAKSLGLKVVSRPVADVLKRQAAKRKVMKG